MEHALLRNATAERLFFDEHQWETIEAAMARIIPTDQDPGAREAACVRFVDRYLSGIDYIYAKPDGSGFIKLEGERADAWRQRVSTFQQRYLGGIAEMDRRSNRRFGTDFAHLTEAQQDEVLRDMERGVPENRSEELVQEKVTGAFGTSSSEPALQRPVVEEELDFFGLLCLHTRQAFYADPIYGGNKDRVGWKVIGFEGPSSLREVYDGTYDTFPYFAKTGDRMDQP